MKSTKFQKTVTRSSAAVEFNESVFYNLKAGTTYLQILHVLNRNIWRWSGTIHAQLPV